MDEEALEMGANLYAQFAIDFLNSKKQDYEKRTVVEFFIIQQFLFIWLFV